VGGVDAREGRCSLERAAEDVVEIDGRGELT
jgi:hypothetical protein